MGRIAAAYSGSKSGEQLRVKIARKLGRPTPADMYDKGYYKLLTAQGFAVILVGNTQWLSKVLFYQLPQPHCC